MRIKHFLVGFLISLLFFQFIGFYSFFSIEKANIKKQIKFYLKNGVPESLRINFVLTKVEYNKLLFIKPEKEFKIGNRMFDIVNKKSYKNKIYLSCINDVQESNLFKNLSKFIDNNLNHSDNKNQNLFKLSNPYYIVCKLLNFKYFPLDNIKHKFFNYSFSLKTNIVIVFVPPPIC